MKNNPESTMNLEPSGDLLTYYSRKLDDDGVVVIPNVFTVSQIERFRDASKKSFEEVKVAIEKRSKKEMNYITAFDRVYHNKKHYYDLNDGSIIIELAKGRYDYTFDTAQGVFASDEFMNPEPIQTLMRMKLRSQYTHFAGTVPAVGMSDDGPWHRDLYPLFDTGEDPSGKYDDSIEVKIMPPIYYTVLIPLEKVTAHNGATEFISGSHRLSYEESIDRLRFQPDVEVGSVLLFDGRVFHRGRANQSEDPRMVLYQVYHKKWYQDY